MTNESLSPQTARTAVGRHLVTLREEQNLTLTQAAHLLGLGQSNGRKTLSRWELDQGGRPQKRHRENMLRYLWHSLQLCNRPAHEFNELWDLIAVAWDWDALTAEDWQYLQSPASAQMAAMLWTEAEQFHSPQEISASDEEKNSPQSDVEEDVDDAQNEKRGDCPTEATSERQVGKIGRREQLLPVVETESVTESADEPPLPFRLPQAATKEVRGIKRWVWGAVALLLLGLIPLWMLLAPTGSPQTTGAAAITNLDFERGDLTAWMVHDGSCVTSVADGRQAYEGDNFAEIDSSRDGCTSLSYNFRLPWEVGETFRFAIYAKSAKPQLQEMETVFWTGHHPLEKNGVDLNLKQAVTHIIDSESWRCLEVTYTVANPAYDVVRAALHWPKDQATHLLVDGARIGFGTQSLCTEISPHILDGDFEQTTDTLAWFFNGEEPCQWSLTAETGAAFRGQKALQIDRKASDCYSVAQRIPTKPRAGTTYRAAAWVHVAPNVLGSATWRLWARGKEHVYGNQFTRLAGNEWRCLEAELLIDEGEYDHLAVELFLETAGTIYTIDHVQIAATNKPLCPPQDLLLNPDFEQGATPVGWAQHANSECLSTVIQEPTAAHTGEQFARVSKTATCYSLFQDIYREPKAGDTATFGLWVRGQDAKPTRVSLQLFGLDAPLTTNRADYFLTDDGWTCVQVQLHIEESIYRYWRGEIYFHDDGTDYDLDSAQFRLDEKSVCPQGSYAITGLDLVPGQSAVVGATLSGRLTVVNTGEHPAPATQTRYWLADSKQGPPLHSESMGSLELSTLAAEESQLYYFDLRLPLDIESDKAYYLLSELSTGSIDTTTDLPSIRLQIEPCFGETIFCDIPDGYWAQPEAEAAYAAGITGGCRSDAQAYHNLPFCPNQILWPEQMAVFFLRYINGGNYRPVGRFQSHYIDVTEGQNFAHWIDAFYPVIGDFARANCLQIDETRRFCPEQPVLRRDLLLAIGRILDIDLQQIDSPLTQTTHYVDLQDDPAVETLASYFWAKRILPDMDPNCPDQGFGPRFCGNDVARRVDAIVWMARAFSSEFSN